MPSALEHNIYLHSIYTVLGSISEVQMINVKGRVCVDNTHVGSIRYLDKTLEHQEFLVSMRCAK